MINILIADDQELMRQSLKIMLSSQPNFAVTDTVSNGREVLESIKKNKPDIILMDIRMPEMDGVVCTQKVKEMAPDIKVIILTTSDDDEFVFNAIKFGASGYLLKGTSLKDLTSAITKVYNGKSIMNDEITGKVFRMFSQMAQTNQTIRVGEQLTGKLRESEWKIIECVGRGMSNKEIAQRLHLSEGTIRNSLSVILSKLGLKNRTQLGIWAVQTDTAGSVRTVYTASADSTDDAEQTGRSVNIQTAEQILARPVFYCFLLLVFAPVAEEILFRKLFFDRLMVLGTKPAIILSAVFFALPHLISQGPTQVFYTFILGLSFGFVTARTRKLWPAMILHSLSNLYCGIISAVWPQDNPLFMLAYTAIYVLAVPAAAVVRLILNRRKMMLRDQCATAI